MNLSAPANSVTAPVTTVIRVLIADDHAMVREGIKQVLAETDDIVVVGEAKDCETALTLSRQHEWDVLVLDISLPDGSGLDVLKQVHKEFPKLPVLMFSMHREDQYAIRSLKAGAAGYLNKQIAPVELVNAIRHVAGGRKYVTLAIAEDIARQMDIDYENPAHSKLSDREYQMLVMIGSGKTVGNIATELTLSVKTISMYRTRLLKKMRLRNNSELVCYVHRNGMLEHCQ